MAEGRNPRDVKFELAQELVARFHDASAAERSQRDFVARVSEKALPTDLVAKVVQVEATGMRIGNVLKEAGLAASSSEANRKIDEKAVKVDGTRVSDRGLTFNAGADHRIPGGIAPLRPGEVRAQGLSSAVFRPISGTGPVRRGGAKGPPKRKMTVC